ncbi:hypothetical protein HZH66_009642 [Vespula vulgaris]|uniref:Uncharacterized protein n=1 Tax=Vespula vulgaris TaxID=7454 RepID=A0A834JN45_VESVU|nr:hypothetical protein HZH66_009642 [Vespula vulgaris]
MTMLIKFNRSWDWKATQPHRSDRDTEGTGYKMGGWFNLQREPLGFYRGLLPRNFALSGSANPRALDKRF